MVYAYVGVLALAMMVVRVNVVEARARTYNPGADLHGATLGFLAMLSVFALIAYGFIRLDWHWPVLGIAAGVVLQFLVTRESFAALRAIRIPLEILAVGGCIYLWALR